MVGPIGELLALDYLVLRGYILLTWNLYNKSTQIDLVFLHPEDSSVVGVEVKASLNQYALVERNANLSYTKLFLRNQLLNNFSDKLKLFNFGSSQSLLKLGLGKSGPQSYYIKTIEYNSNLLV